MFTSTQLWKQLESFPFPQHSIVLAHTSLRAVGQVEGRGEGLLETLIAYCRSIDTLLCIPTHTWHHDDYTKPVLDMLSDDVCIGTLPKLALHRKDGIRTQNPTHSMVIFGDRKRTEAYASLDDYCSCGTTKDGCYANLADYGGAVLLIGVGLNRNTYMHSVEDRLGVPNRLSEIRPITVKLADGHIIDHPMRVHSAEGIGDVSAFYPKYEPAFRQIGAIHDGFIGNAKTMLCDCQKMQDMMEHIYRQSHGAELLCDDQPLKTELYM